jgi:hypothetical protein
MLCGETVKNGDFPDSEEDAIDAVVLYFQSTSDFPSRILCMYLIGFSLFCLAQNDRNSPHSSEIGHKMATKNL